MRRSLLLRRKVRITTVVAEVVIVEGSLGRTVRFVTDFLSAECQLAGQEMPQEKKELQELQAAK